MLEAVDEPETLVRLSDTAKADADGAAVGAPIIGSEHRMPVTS
jgi:hypothetical protein